MCQPQFRCPHFFCDLRRFVHCHVLMFSGFDQLVGFAIHSFQNQQIRSLGILTDSAYIQLEGQGVACLEMGFPARYTHTPVEVCDVRDIDALATVCAGMMRRIDKTFQINRY